MSETRQQKNEIEEQRLALQSQLDQSTRDIENLKQVQVLAYHENFLYSIYFSDFQRFLHCGCYFCVCFRLLFALML